MIRRRHLFVPRIPLSDLHRRLRLGLGQLRPLSASSNSGNEAAPPPATVDGGDGIITREEAYRQIQNLDFMKAAKILFTTPPKRKQFGFDFHLVQFFFACMPSLAVYLVAQYARHEIRRMEAEAEVKKKQAEEAEERAGEEEKAKEAELRIKEDPVLSKVIGRLDALEEVVKEIVDEKKATPALDAKKDQEVNKSPDPQVQSKSAEPKPESNKETSGSPN